MESYNLFEYIMKILFQRLVSNARTMFNIPIRYDPIEKIEMLCELSQPLMGFLWVTVKTFTTS